MNKPAESISCIVALPTASRSPRRRLFLAWTVIAMLFAAAAAAYFLGILGGTRRPVYRVEHTEIVQTIVASGRVQTPFRVEIGSQVTGTVAAIPVVEGQAVKRGQLLVALDDREAKAAVEQSQAALVQAQARLTQLRELGLPVALQAVRQAEVNLQNVQRQYARSRQLRSQGFIGQAQLDDAQRNVDVAESQLHTARLQAQSNARKGSDYLLAVAAVEQAQANLRMARAKLDYSSIEAPANGVLIARDVERGDVVQPGKILMVLSPDGQTQLVVQMDERNLAGLRVGQKALASADAYALLRFAAELVYINPAVDPQRGSVEVKFNVPNPPAYLRQDMTVSVDTEVAHRSAALAVPAETVHDIDGDSPWVWKLDKGRAFRQSLKVGAHGGARVEVLEGLQTGDRVIGGGRITQGQRIRALTAGGKPKS